MRPAEGGEEVVQRLLVCQVDNREAETPLVAVSIEEVVMAHAKVEQVAWRNALRIVVVVFLAGCWNFDEFGSKFGCRARGKRRSRGTWSGRLAVASEPGLKLLVGGQRQSCEVVNHQY